MSVSDITNGKSISGTTNVTSNESQPENELTYISFSDLSSVPFYNDSIITLEDFNDFVTEQGKMLSDITGITIGSSTQVLRPLLFNGCINLQSVTFQPDSKCTVIHEYVFSNTNNIINLFLFSKVKK